MVGRIGAAIAFGLGGGFRPGGGGGAFDGGGGADDADGVVASGAADFGFRSIWPTPAEPKNWSSEV